jgi:hypothetical protein
LLDIVGLPLGDLLDFRFKRRNVVLQAYDLFMPGVTKAGVKLAELSWFFLVQARSRCDGNLGAVSPQKEPQAEYATRLGLGLLA